LVNPEAIELVA